MAYYIMIETAIGKYDTYGPYKTRDEARRNLKRIYRTKYMKKDKSGDCELNITTSRNYNNGRSVIGQLATMHDKKSNKVLYWVYFSDPFGECIPYIMNDNGTLKRKLRDDEW